jgi:hypothetical protein
MSDTSAVVVPDTPAVREALALMLWHTGPVAGAFRAAGHVIKRRAEDEQAFTLRWALNLALQHGDQWRNVAEAELQALRPASTEASA